MDAAAFRKLLDPKWLTGLPGVVSNAILFCSLVAIGVASRWDLQSEEDITQKHRETLLFRVKETPQDANRDVDDDADDDDSHGEDPPGRPGGRFCCRFFSKRCCCAVLSVLREYFDQLFDLFLQATGGDDALEMVKETLANADVAAVSNCIAILQAHRFGACEDTIAEIGKFTETGAEDRAAPLALEDQDAPDVDEVLAVVPNEDGPARDSGRPSFFSMGSAINRKVGGLREKASQLGSGAAQNFLQSNWFCRVLMLFPALHPFAELVRFSLMLPYNVRVAFIVMKVIGAGALGALFFSSSSPTPDSDPECTPPKDPFENLVQTATVGFVTALLEDMFIFFLALIQRKNVVERDEWTPELKERQWLRWRIRTGFFWLGTTIYIAGSHLYTSLFLANVRPVDALDWINAMIAGLVQDLLVKPMFFAALFGTVSSMVLCCRPDVKRAIEVEYMQQEKPRLESQDSIFDESDSEASLSGAQEQAVVPWAPRPPEESIPFSPSAPAPEARPPWAKPTAGLQPPVLGEVVQGSVILPPPPPPLREDAVYEESIPFLPPAPAAREVPAARGVPAERGVRPPWAKPTAGLQTPFMGEVVQGSVILPPMPPPPLKEDYSVYEERNWAQVPVPGEVVIVQGTVIDSPDLTPHEDPVVDGRVWLPGMLDE